MTLKYPNEGSNLLPRLLKVSVFLIVLSCLLALPAAEAGFRDLVLEKTLPNGLKVLLLENHKAPLITFQVWYRVGSRNEAWGKTGLSHMLEHMMFKGTRKISGPEFSRIIQENGGNDNAFTTKDYTAYFENLSADRLQIPIDLESDRMQNLNLREEDFRTERLVVMEERRMRTDDNPQATLMEQLEATAFQVQPYHWPIIGWMGDLTRLTLEDLQKHYQAYYSPANALLVAVGDFQKEALLPAIEKAFGAIPRRDVPAEMNVQDPRQPGERRVVVKREAQLPSLVMGYHVPNLREPDSYVLEVIAALLGQGKSSRLYESLIWKKQLALGADADYSILSRDPGLFYLFADPLPGKEVAEVEKALEEEITRLQNEPVEERELQKAKNQLESSFIFSQDSLFVQAMLLARHEIAQDWKAADDYLPAIRKVTAEEIRRVAKLFLVPENRTVGILIPLSPQDGDAPPAGSALKEQGVR
jgi:zinc protease